MGSGAVWGLPENERSEFRQNEQGEFRQNERSEFRQNERSEFSGSLLVVFRLGLGMNARLAVSGRP
ncbi:hypothetical protein A7Q00_01315 [Eikenella halliae]|uniref:Uncharacterized protein n=2 Tax=Eikenella halliae TaxID=1795832 RepID=A0A1B6W1D6_9NEIS|nr:hypothetical protein A7Q00_01315 [Eikenella halliae]